VPTPKRLPYPLIPSPTRINGLTRNLPDILATEPASHCFQRKAHGLTS